MVKQIAVLVESHEVNVHKVTLLVDESTTEETIKEAALTKSSMSLT